MIMISVPGKRGFHMRGTKLGPRIHTSILVCMLVTGTLYECNHDVFELACRDACLSRDIALEPTDGIIAKCRHLPVSAPSNQYQLSPDARSHIPVIQQCDTIFSKNVQDAQKVAKDSLKDTNFDLVHDIGFEQCVEVDAAWEEER